MTTTPKQMTLERASADIDDCCSNNGLAGSARMRRWKAAIDAELSKQRSAEPVASTDRDDLLKWLGGYLERHHPDSGVGYDRMADWLFVKLKRHQRNAAEVTDEYGEPVTQIIDKLLSELSNAIEDVEAGKHKSSVLAFLNLAKEYGHAARDVICAIDAARQENKP